MFRSEAIFGKLKDNCCRFHVLPNVGEQSKISHHHRTHTTYAAVTVICFSVISRSALMAMITHFMNSNVFSYMARVWHKYQNRDKNQRC